VKITTVFEAFWEPLGKLDDSDIQVVANEVCILFDVKL
jgi:hypothetical protein